MGDVLTVAIRKAVAHSPGRRLALARAAAVSHTTLVRVCAGHLEAPTALGERLAALLGEWAAIYQQERKRITRALAKRRKAEANRPASAYRGSRASTSVKREYLAWVSWQAGWRRMAPNRGHWTRKRMLWLYGQLWSCADPIPDKYAAFLKLPRRASFALAVRAAIGTEIPARHKV